MAATIEITEFRNLRPQDGEKLKAFIDVVFNDALVVKGFKIINGTEGLFVAPPARQVDPEKNDGRRWNDVIYFTKASNLRTPIFAQILQYYKDNIASATTAVTA
jgi:DNA-binding cell septation regulator SpoVG